MCVTGMERCRLLTGSPRGVPSEVQPTDGEMAMALMQDGLDRSVISFEDVQFTYAGDNTLVDANIVVSGTTENDVVIAISAEVPHTDSTRAMLKSALQRAMATLSCALEDR